MAFLTAFKIRHLYLSADIFHLVKKIRPVGRYLCHSLQSEVAAKYMVCALGQRLHMGYLYKAEEMPQIQERNLSTSHMWLWPSVAT
jgi:hypothetical protein